MADSHNDGRRCHDGGCCSSAQIEEALLHAPGIRGKFLRLWPFLVPFDELWALSPFLLLHHINFGLALACTALLAGSPFAQRSLVLMRAGGAPPEVSAPMR